MAKRKFPLICIDTRRTIGEFDTIICTDIDSGFVANIYFENDDALTPVANKNLEYLSERSALGITTHAKVERIFGKNPNDKDIARLLSHAMKQYNEERKDVININNPTPGQMIDYITRLVDGNRQNLAECGSDVENRQIVLYSMAMLSHIKNYIREKEGGRP